jgi:three-Cys-motif partner protein
VVSNQRFGGDWTAEKLERVRRYLLAYTKIMSRQPFEFSYIDAFAGTGYVEIHQGDTGAFPIPDLIEEEPQRFINGSARIALEVDPRFTQYIWIEKSEKRCQELYQLKEEFPDRSGSIQILISEANQAIQKICLETDWRKNRAVIFLDPYGMQVNWETIEAIAATRAIDMWLLFPLGVGVNRMLKKDGNMDESWMKKLDNLFGTHEWYDNFYQIKTTGGLFGEMIMTEKTATIPAISAYFVDRLKTVFAGVAENPLSLYNTKNNPLFLLCFAAGNPKGAPIALRIAQHILGMRR